MVSLKHIQPMTEFKRNSADLIERMRAGGFPLVLTMNGKAECVVQDPDRYEEIQRRLEALEAENEQLKLAALRAAVQPAILAANSGDMIQKTMREIVADIKADTRS